MDHKSYYYKPCSDNTRSGDHRTTCKPLHFDVRTSPSQDCCRHGARTPQLLSLGVPHADCPPSRSPYRWKSEQKTYGWRQNTWGLIRRASGFRIHSSNHGATTTTPSLRQTPMPHPRFLALFSGESSSAAPSGIVRLHTFKNGGAHSRIRPINHHPTR